jgi:hypothetical protein
MAEPGTPDLSAGVISVTPLVLSTGGAGGQGGDETGG